MKLERWDDHLISTIAHAGPVEGAELCFAPEKGAKLRLTAEEMIMRIKDKQSDHIQLPVMHCRHEGAEQTPTF